MPRYVVECTFPTGLASPTGAEPSRELMAGDAAEGVTWISSFVSENRGRSFCIYDAPTPEAIRKAAASTGLPIDRITRVDVLDPYAYLTPG